MTTVLATAEEQKVKYLSAVEACHTSFLPFSFVVCVDGTKGHEASAFLQHLAYRLSGKELESGPILDQNSPYVCHHLGNWPLS